MSARRRLQTMQFGVQAIRAWPLWELPSWLVGFIAAIVAVFAGAVGLAAYAVHLNAHDLLRSGLCCCA